MRCTMRQALCTTTATLLVGACLVTGWDVSFAFGGSNEPIDTPYAVVPPLASGLVIPPQDDLLSAWVSPYADGLAPYGWTPGDLADVVPPGRSGPQADGEDVGGAPGAPRGGTFIVPEPASALLLLAGMGVLRRHWLRRG